jgi:hypothetical protein
LRRRILRRLGEGEDQQYLQIPFVVPTVVKEVKEKASPLASFLFVIGALLLFVAFALQLISWVASKLPSFIPFPITIPAELLAWLPIMFVAGVALSIISIIISPSTGKFLLTLVFAVGYLALALGWI